MAATIVAPVVNGTLKVIDATSATNHSVSASPGFGVNCQPLAIVFKTIKAEGVSSDCIVSFGFNSSTFDDVLKTYAIRPSTEAFEILILNPHSFQFIDNSNPYEGPSSASLKIVSAATATVFTFTYAFVYDPAYDLTVNKASKEQIVYKLLNNFTL